MTSATSEAADCTDAGATSFAPPNLASLGVADLGRRRRSVWRLPAADLEFAGAAIVACRADGRPALAWHNSLQHETIHGHPTRSKRVNAALGATPLALWLPYELYRVSHLRHHADAGRHLTVPGRDPEAHYIAPGALAGLGPLRRAALRLNRTLAGRLILGPAVVVLRLWTGELRWPVDRRRLGIWLRHAVGVGAVLGWVVGVCRIPIFLYIGAIVYPSVSLSLLRSFAEHRAAQEACHRTAVVEAHAVWALLFLNNQLHLVHHASPRLPWYDLPRAWRDMALSADIGSGLLFRGGYAEVAQKYLFRPFITTEHPGWSPE
ncbi:MAG TPA: fatty acid desaturase [Stellaceae bacterium]|nr:fatty acid desaturase [Stellaceae bacterium]